MDGETPAGIQVTDGSAPAIPVVVKVTVFRYAPDVDAEPRYETYEVPYTKGMRVLDVLEAIREELGHAVAYRWLCGVKKCGMCAMTVNGRPSLTCWEPAEPEMTIEPLGGFRVIRDLVVDRDPHDAKLRTLDLVLHRSADRPYPGFPEPLTATEMARAAEMMNCIQCLLCVASCPTVGEKFMGPAALVQVARWAFDPRDGEDRAAYALYAGIGHCADCGDCTTACPAHIPVKEMAIAGLRELCASEGYTGYGPAPEYRCGDEDRRAE
ncbi:MAG: 2Fe-2S iron-sulfur cluster-binding protein [Armatimonadota bacterium]|nr:2Fe-2S iron-sulfur cluster-binding protein [Armatimonadota bacterium]